MTAGSLPPPVVEENQQGSKAPGSTHLLCSRPPNKLPADYREGQLHRKYYYRKHFKFPFLTLHLLTKSTGEDMHPGHLNTEVNETIGAGEEEGHASA